MGNKTLKAGLFAALAAGALWVLPMTVCAAPIFPEGISTDGESLAGKTWEDALHTAEEKVKKQADVSVALTIEDKKAETTAGELGIHWSNQEEAEKELKSYVGGSLIRQYMNKKDLEKTPVDVTVQTAADPDKIRAFVDTHCDGVLAQPQDASIRRENGAFVITESVLGKVVDADATASTLNTAFEGLKDSIGEISVQAVIKEEQPKITSDDLKTIEVPPTFPAAARHVPLILQLVREKSMDVCLCLVRCYPVMNVYSRLPSKMVIRQLQPMKMAR